MFSKKYRYVDSSAIEFLREREMANRWTIFDTLQYHKIEKTIESAKISNKHKVFIYTLRPAVKRRLVESGFYVYRSLGTYWTIYWK